MKKLTVVAIAGLVFLSAALFVPAAAAAESGTCFEDHMFCRENALNMDAPWYQVTLVLTLCDLALAKCILRI